MKVSKMMMLGFVLLLVPAAMGWAHCQIPCGIYDDQLRVNLMYEHIQTIEKSINKINELSAADKVDYNQLVRWVNNKDVHADKLKTIVAEYFLDQRIKPTEESDGEAYKKYLHELSLLHQLSVWAMKSKQSSNVETVSEMREKLDDFAKSYFHQEEDHMHMHEGEMMKPMEK